MKNLLNLIFALTVLVFATSCEKEGLEDSSMEQAIAEEDLSGESLPEYTITKDEFRNQVNQINKSPLAAKQTDFSEIKTEDEFTRSRTITPIHCGDTKYWTTINETNTVSILSGADKVYELDIQKKSEVEINLSHLSGDLDLYLTEIITDGFGRRFVGNVLSYSNLGGNSNEQIKTTLEEDSYFIIVETYSGESPFRLNVNCKNVNGPFKYCEDYENMRASYSYGVSRQSNLWEKWSSRARDGLVLYEDSRYDNKVVKFDAGRFGYQDAVRSLLNLPITRGLYQLSWKMYVPYNKRGDFLTEKTSDYGQEQGLLVTLDEGYVVVKSGNKERTANTQFNTDEWIDIDMWFDMKYGKIYTFIDNQILIISNANAKINSSYRGLNSIYGVDFFTVDYQSKFHIDDVCMTEWEPGFDDPLQVQQYTQGIEIIDLTK